MFKCILLILSLFLISCESCDKPTPYHYVNQPEVQVETKTIPVYIDNHFSDVENSQIQIAISQWNATLNGYLKLEIAGTFDMEIELLEEARLHHAYLIIKLDPNSPLLSNSIGEKTLGFADSIGGSYLYLVPELVKNDLYGVALHEIGHLLGAKHTPSGLMYKNYYLGKFICIDILAAQEVGNYQDFDWTKMNYCTP